MKRVLEIAGIVLLALALLGARGMTRTEMKALWAYIGSLGAPPAEG